MLIVNLKYALLELPWLDIIAVPFISQIMMEGANVLCRRTISELTISCCIYNDFVQNLELCTSRGGEEFVFAFVGCIKKNQNL